MGGGEWGGGGKGRWEDGKMRWGGRGNGKMGWGGGVWRGGRSEKMGRGGNVGCEGGEFGRNRRSRLVPGLGFPEDALFSDLMGLHCMYIHIFFFFFFMYIYMYRYM